MTALVKVIFSSNSYILELLPRMRPHQEGIQRMIIDTISLLCRNTLSHGVGIRIQGLIGITVGESDVHLVQFDESYDNDVSGSEASKQQNVDVGSSLNTSVAEPPRTNPRKRPRLSEASDLSTACNTPRQQPAAAVEDCDVIFVADDVIDNNNVKPEFDQFLNFVDDDNYNYDQIGDSSQLFKTEDTLAATDLNVCTNDGENQRSKLRRHSAQNVLLRDLLVGQNSFTSDEDATATWQPEDTDWQPESDSYDEMPVQTASVRREPKTARPRIKQVVILFTGRGFVRSKKNLCGQ